MQESSDTNTDVQSHLGKRVSVRSGGAGHAHSGIKDGSLHAKDGEATPLKNGKIVRLGR